MNALKSVARTQRVKRIQYTYTADYLTDHRMLIKYIIITLYTAPDSAKCPDVAISLKLMDININ